MKKKIKKILRDFFKILKQPEMRILPGQISFFFLMSIIPLIAVCIMIVSIFTTNIDVLTTIKEIIPEPIFNTIEPLLENTNNLEINTLIFLGSALLLASNAPKAIIIATNTFYKIKHHSYFKTKIKAFLMTLIILFLLLFMIFIPILGDTILKILIRLFNISNHLTKYKLIYEFLKLFTSFIFIYLCIKALYTLAPSIEINKKTTTMGSLFTTISWIFVSDLFAFYITNIANYSLLYGNFANILILLLWIYLLSYLFIIGMAINMNNYKLEKERAVLEVVR